jgi:N-formylmaleamate deformylase
MQAKILILLLSLSLASPAARAQHLPPAHSFGVTIAGHGPPMILIPGLNSPGALMDTIVDHFKDRYKCYVITLAGFAGQPPSPAGDNLLTGQKNEIIQYIRSQHLDKPVLTGFSFGGTLALWIAISAPHLLGPVIDIDGLPFENAFFDPNVDKDSLISTKDAIRYRLMHWDSTMWQKLYDNRNSPEGLSEGRDYLQKLVSDSARIDLLLAWDQATNLRSSLLMQLDMDTLDLRDRLPAIATPMLVLGSWKGWDDSTPRDSIELLYRQQFKRAKKCTILFSGQGKHFLMWEDPQWLLDKMSAFLAGTPPRLTSP